MLNPRLRGGNAVALALALLFFTWTVNFLWAAVELSWLSRAADALWIVVVCAMIFASHVYRVVLRRIAPVLATTTALLVVSLLRDADHPYRGELYFKTVAYTNLAALAGAACVMIVLASPARVEWFSRYCAWVFALFILAYALYLYAASGIAWRPGVSLLRTSLADYYQGMSRLMAVAVLVVAATRRHLPLVIVYAAVSTAILVTISFAGVGALAGFSLAAFWFLRAPLAQVGAKRLVGIASAVVVIGAIAYSLAAFDTFEVSQRLMLRLERKVEVPTGVDFGRRWLMSEGLRLWTSEPTYFVIGAGALTYSCAVHYCNEYRHPHNLFVLGVVWFGLTSLPLAVLIVREAFRAMRRLVIAPSATAVFSLLLLNYFLLAMFGGDLEQNRHLIFMVSGGYVMDVLQATRRARPAHTHYVEVA